MIDRDKTLYFKRGYKYQVSKPYHIKLDIKPFKSIDLPFIKFDLEGNLTIITGYAWNGASGPTYDTLNSMIGSLIHDVIYQLIRLDKVDYACKEYADKLLHDICVEDGMFSFRASYWLWAVLHFGSSSCLPSAEPKDEVAP